MSAGPGTAWDRQGDLRPAGGWVGEAPPREGLPVYLDVLRARGWLIALLVALGVGTAALYLATAEKVYEAKADLLVTPVSRDLQGLVGLGLVSESGDPTRDVETAAQLITTPAVATRVRTRLDYEGSTLSLLNQVEAQPVAQSNIVSITAKADDPSVAADVANAFGAEAVAERTDRLHRLLDSLVPRLEQQIAELPAREEAARTTLAARLQDLQTLRALPDPTLHFETRAVPPTAAVAPRPVLTLAAALLASIVLGIGAALGAHVLDTRIGREEELRRYRIPILARIPLGRRHTIARGAILPTARGAILPRESDPSARDAYARLAASLRARLGRQKPRTVFITGSAPAEGKTTTAINLAAALGAMDERVILIDGDTRRPGLLKPLAVEPAGLTNVMGDGVAVSEALRRSELLPPNVRVLPLEHDPGSGFGELPAEAAQALVAEAERLADWVVIDGPALNYAPDAVPLAKLARSMIIVARLRRTRTTQLQELAEVLVQQGITPDGFVVVGSKPNVIRY